MLNAGDSPCGLSDAVKRGCPVAVRMVRKMRPSPIEPPVLNPSDFRYARMSGAAVIVRSTKVAIW